MPVIWHSKIFSSISSRCCSILYKTKLPFILVFNKTDVQPHNFALEWMQDFEAFQTALAAHRGTTDAEGEPTYMNSLMNSMSLVLDEFYKHLKVRLLFISTITLLPDFQAVGVSSMTGDGIKEFFEAVEASREEYETCVHHRSLYLAKLIHPIPDPTFQNSSAYAQPAKRPFRMLKLTQ